MQASMDPFCELPVKGSGSSFLLTTGFDGWPQRFSWLAATGVHHGSLAFESGSSKAEASSFINNLHMWQLERAEKAKDLGPPLSMVSSIFPAILHKNHNMHLITHIGCQLSMSIPLPQEWGRGTDCKVLFTSDSLLIALILWV